MTKVEGVRVEVQRVRNGFRGDVTALDKFGNEIEDPQSEDDNSLCDEFVILSDGELDPKLIAEQIATSLALWRLEGKAKGRK